MQTILLDKVIEIKNHIIKTIKSEESYNMDGVEMLYTSLRAMLSRCCDNPCNILHVSRVSSVITISLLKVLQAASYELFPALLRSRTLP